MTTAGAVPVTAGRWDHTRTGRLVLGGLWTDAALVMAASAWNGGRALAVLGDPFWSGALLGLAVDVGLAVALVGDRALHLAGRTEPWGRALRIATAGMSLALNCAVPVWLGQPGLAVFHAFLPVLLVLLVLLSEYAQHSTLQFGQITTEHHATLAAEREAQLAAEHAAWQAQQTRTAGGHHAGRDDQAGAAPAVPPPAPARFQVVVNRSGPAAVDRIAGRPAERSTDRPAEAVRTASQTEIGPDLPVRSGSARRDAPVGRQRTGRPRTDAELSEAVREIAERNGRPPSQYQLKQALGVGSGRAARLLAGLATTPAGDPVTNGAAARTEGTR